MRLTALPLVVLCACGPIRGTFEMGITSPIAVGAIVFAKPSSSTTTRVGLTDTVRYNREVTILSSAIEPADAWQKVECANCGGGVEYRALRENSGTITVQADDGFGAETFVKPIEALMPSSVKLFVKPCEQLAYQAGIDFKLYLQLLRGDRVLTDNRFELGSFAVAGGATLEGTPSALWVKTGTASGTGRISSSIDPAFAVPFTVFTPADVSAIDVVPYSPMVTTVTVGRTTSFAVTLSHPGAPACEDRMVRNVGTLTPDVCDMLGATKATRTDDGRYHLLVHGKKAGACTVTASVEGTQVSVARDIQIVEMVDAGVPDGG